MPLWKPKPTLELVTLIRKDNPNKPKTLEALVKAFHKSQPYNGVCQACCVNPWTEERIIRKVKSLIVEADKLAEKNKTPKGSLVMPNRAAKPSKNKNSTQSAPAKSKPIPTTLEEMLKEPIKSARAPKKTARKGPERRSAKKTLESVAHSAAVKAGTKTERRKRA